MIGWVVVFHLLTERFAQCSGLCIANQFTHAKKLYSIGVADSQVLSIELLDEICNFKCHIPIESEHRIAFNACHVEEKDAGMEHSPNIL